MAYNRSEVSQVAAILERALALDAKASLVEARAQIVIDDVDDFAVSAPAQVTAYIASKRAQRDALVLSVKPTVAGWN